jgi:hypothetical protein
MTGYLFFIALAALAFRRDVAPGGFISSPMLAAARRELRR